MLELILYFGIRIFLIILMAYGFNIFILKLHEYMLRSSEQKPREGGP